MDKPTRSRVLNRKNLKLWPQIREKGKDAPFSALLLKIALGHLAAAIGEEERGKVASKWENKR